MLTDVHGCGSGCVSVSEVSMHWLTYFLDGPAIWLDGELSYGTSAPCKTFKSDVCILLCCVFCDWYSLSYLQKQKPLVGEAIKGLSHASFVCSEVEVVHFTK